MKARLVESGSTCEAAGHGQHLPRDVRRLARSERLPRVTFHEAVEWFKGLGYSVEPGPGLDEVTLINDRRPDFIAHIVVPAEKIVAMASLSQVVTAQQVFRPYRMEVPRSI